MSNTQMHLPTDLVSIKVGRFEQSPYFDFYNNPDTIAEPLIFVEVAMMAGIPRAITPILAKQRQQLEPISSHYGCVLFNF